MDKESVKLSKNLLRMKFMQRGLDAETKKQLEEDERRIISDEHWYLDLPELAAKESVVVEEASFVPCEQLNFGRISFKGFNPDVEKLMALMNPRDEEEKEEEEELSRMQTDITDEEMALRYESLVGSMKKKFVKKRDRAVLDDNQNQNQDQGQNQDQDQDQNQDQKPTEPKRVFLKPQD
ncbi:hypothetical protein INR49_020662 [Caranx melampygus]|nr:hypothetical protein INR49_020662 [Caranx melampygus]